MGILNLLLTLAAVPLTLGAAVSTSAPRPLVIWHGMGKWVYHVQLALTKLVPGDSYASPAMVEFGELIAEMHPGIFIHSVYIEEDQEQDRRATFVRCMLLHPPSQFTHRSFVVRKREPTNRLRRSTDCEHHRTQRRFRRNWVFAGWTVPSRIR